MSDSDFSRLQDLLLAADRQQQAELAQRLGELETTLQALPRLLPQTIEAADQAGPRLGRALLKPVAAALTALARSDRQLFVSVLFPVIGPIIRRAIADAFSSMLRNLNRTLEMSLSWRSWRWRLEARRTGVPFAQVVLKHTLAYRIEHLLWIETGSGLLLAHATNSDAEIADRDAIAGMLTAISDFVRDAVLARADESLDRVEMGAFSVRLLRTPQAYLAVVVRGELPDSLLDGLGGLSEQLHDQLPDEPRGYSNEAEGTLADWLAQSGQTEALRAGAGAGARRPWLAVGLILLLLGLLGWNSYHRYAEHSRISQWRAQLDAQPGLQVSSLERVDGVLLVHGKRDPLALDDAALAAMLGLPANGLRGQWQLQHSTDPQILALRLAQRLAAPPSVSISVSDGQLRLSGEWPDAPDDLDLRLEPYRALLPLDDSALQRGRAPELDVQGWQSAADGLRPRFVGGATDPGATAQVQVQQLAALIRNTAQQHPAVRFVVSGGSDGLGSARTNSQLREARARWLHEQLVSAGVDPGLLVLDEEGESASQVDADARSARVRLLPQGLSEPVVSDAGP